MLAWADGDAGDDGGAELDAGAEGEDDAGGLDEAGVLGDADADEDDTLVGLGDADVDGLPDPDVVGDGEAERLAEADGDADVNVDGEALAGWVAAALDVAPAEAGALVAECPAGTADTCAAGDWAGAAGFPAKEVRAKAVAADAANTAPTTPPSTSGRRKRCLDRALPPPVPAAADWGPVSAGGGGGIPGVVAAESLAAVNWAPAADAPAADAGAEPSAVCVTTASGPGSWADSGIGLVAAAPTARPASPAPDAAAAGPSLGSRAIVWVIDSGSQFPPTWRAPASDSNSAAVGRSAGFLARQRSISGRTAGGT